MYCHKDGVYLRKAGSHDLSILRELKSESWWGTHNVVIANEEDQKRWFDSLRSDQLCMIAGNKDAEIIGMAMYSEIDMQSRSLSLSGSILESQRSRPHVKHAFSAGLDFAFEMLNVERVQAEVLECNFGAQQLEIAHLGFTIEGCRRRAVYKCGRYYDSLLLGILREEWESNLRVKTYGGSCNTTFDHMRAEANIEKSRVSFQDKKSTSGKKRRASK